MKITDAESQTHLSGKTYEAQVHYVGKKMPGGGCAITEFCVLTFSREIVTVHFYAKASCVPKELEADYSYDSSDKKETYQWTKSENLITINGFDKYGTFEHHDNKLISSKGFFEGAAIEFTEKLVGQSIEKKKWWKIW
jgi:hypothetical protein